MTDYGYARVSTGPQDLIPQVAALRDAGIPTERIYLEKRSGATVHRGELAAVRAVMAPGDRLTVVRLDRLARNLRDTLNLIHELTDEGIGVRTLRDPIPIDTSAEDSPMARMAVLLLALMAEMELVWNRERVASARAVGKRPGRPRTITAERLAMARGLFAEGESGDGPQRSVREVARLMGVPKSTLARALADELPPPVPANRPVP